MCAIFGFIARRNRPVQFSVLRDIVLANISRGPHAFGFAWIDSRGVMRMFKQSGRLSDQIGALAMVRDARLLVGHLRWATHGSPTENMNNHPHPIDGGWLVHNGVVHNYVELVRSHRLWNLTECDSESIGLLYEQLDGSRLERAAGATKLTRGNLASLSIWSRPNTIVAVRRGNPLHYAHTDRGMYLATLPDGLPGDPRAMRDNRAIEFSCKRGEVYYSQKTLPKQKRSTIDESLFAKQYHGG